MSLTCFCLAAHHPISKTCLVIFPPKLELILDCGEDKDDQGGSCNDCTAGAVAATMVGGYLVYRCVRMLPSVLLPPLWPTIPVNAALP